jgi:hypothetical protein
MTSRKGIDVKRALTVTLCGLALILMAVSPAGARSPWDRPAPKIDPVTGKIMTYSFPIRRAERVGFEDLTQLNDPADQSGNIARVSLGSAASPTGTATSPGAVVNNTYMDDQYRPAGGRMVDFRGKPYIHFTYSIAASPTALSRYGYNVYDPIKGNWPWGAEVGTTVQTPDVTGSWAVLDVNSKGQVALGGDDNAFGALDNHFYYQPSRLSSNFGVGTLIDTAQYNDYFLTKTNQLHHPRVEVQEWAGDTIWHVVATESNYTPNPPPTDVFVQNTVNYFRKVGASASGTWLGPISIDTCRFNAMPSITASRVSPKVAVAYCHYSPTGFTYRQRNDVDIYYRMSDSVGLSWTLPVNITNYPRNVASHTGFTEAKCFYDGQGFLHVIWYARPVVANVYSVPDFFWEDLQSSVFHWSNRTSSISKVHNAEWGLDANQDVCGFGSPNVSYVGYIDISECDGRLYMIFSQYCNFFGNDATPTTPANIDDCSSSFTQRLYAANGEIFMCVSNNLDGTLWDAARNLTKSYTPKCDSAGFGGVCMNDTRATMSRYGMDVTSYDTNLVPVTLTWPGTELVDPTPSPGTYGGNYFLHMFYTEDHWPAPGWRGSTYGKITLNPLKWVRLACVNPVSAPQILYEPSVIGYPIWMPHGKTDTIKVTVTNEGNAPLNITTIGGVKTSAETFNWLGTSVSSLTVPMGSPDTASFDIYLNAGGVINLPGTVVALSGYIFMKSDARTPRDSVVLLISNFLVADTVQQLVWDTVSTSCGVRLVVSNNGDMGRNGYKKVNMDFAALGGECDTATLDGANVYLYDGGPIVVREITPQVAYSWSNQLYQGGFATEESFKPYVGGTPGSFTGTGFDGYRTGTFLNRDSLIGVQATYYAPTGGGDSCNFIIVQRKFFNRGGSAVNHVTIGEQIDWDIPADVGSNNSSAILGGYTVYQRGVDTGVIPDCGTQYDSARFGAGMLFGKYSKAEYDADPCANDVSPVGIFSEIQDTMFNYDSLTDGNLEGRYFWNRMKNQTGLNATPIKNKDLRTVYTWYADRNFTANDTVTIYTALATVKKGTETDLDKTFKKAFEWYKKHLRPTCSNIPGVGGGCCNDGSSDGRTGNIDCDPGKGVDISDLSTLIDFLYISFTPLCCDQAANIDGDPAGGIDISDLSGLIDFLYISFTPTALCK